jgi:YHS domain-containing protein
MNGDLTACCPVCGMQVDSVKYKTQYHKMVFHFCSEQCLETFEAKPQLYVSMAVEKRAPVLKRRKLRLARPCSPEAKKTVEARLLELMGVTDVHIQDDCIEVGYDLLQVTLVQIEQALSELNAQLDGGWWQRLRLGWLRNTEENELDNLSRGPGACCNRPPPGA